MMSELSVAVDKALARIHLADQMREQLYPGEPFYVAYSGGKDSDVIRILFAIADVTHELWHNHTTVDAPETVYYVRSIPNMNVSMPLMSMWQLIKHHGVPPTRLMSYCCTELKERYGSDRFVVTGVRWAESNRRRSMHNTLKIAPPKYKNVINLNVDNDEERRLFETCQLKGKRVLNPIVDWSDEMVWEFLSHYGCASNPLYYQGNKRIGCIGCPLSRNQRFKDFARYPKYRDAYLRTFERMLEERKAKGKPAKAWATGGEVMDWWLDERY